MTLRARPSLATLERHMDTNDAKAGAATGRAVRAFLIDATEAAVASYQSGALTAAAPPRSMLSLGELYGWWTAAVSVHINPVFEGIWRAGYERVTDARVVGSSLDALATYMAAVSDRLVRGLVPPLPDAAMDLVRAAITGGAAQGWSTAQTAERIAKELGWDPSVSYWRRQLAQADRAIDAILDPLGPPGSPLREAARMGDARVKALQVDRANAVRHLDAGASYWQNRATLIARTESTAAYNFGALHAMGVEGVQCKEWLATSDNRTRPDHRAADGQIVRWNQPFLVGGYELRMPGDPSAPPEETCNCRCAMVQASCRDLV